MASNAARLEFYSALLDRLEAAVRDAKADLPKISPERVAGRLMGMQAALELFVLATHIGSLPDVSEADLVSTVSDIRKTLGR